MNKCCKQRRNSTCIGAEEDPTKEMMCRICKETWHELVNPDAGPELLEALKELKKQIFAHHVMNVKKDFSLLLADAAAGKAINNAEGK